MLVFGTLATFSIFNKDLPGNKDRMKALRTARDGVAKIRAEQAIRRAIKHNTPPAVHYKLNSGDKVYEYSESSAKRISGLTLVQRKEENAWINDGHKSNKLNVSQIMPESMHGARDKVCALIKSLSQVKTNPLPDVFITVVLALAEIRE